MSIEDDRQRNVDEFNDMLRRESEERERRRANSGFHSSAGFALATSLLMPELTSENTRRRRMRTIYAPPEPGHAAHLNAAEEKRKRKADKLRKLRTKEGENDV